MAKRKIEVLSGLGDIYADDVLIRADTPYQLSLWADDGPSSDGPTPPEAVTIEGHISIAGIGEAVVLAGPANLTLRLQDGRRLAFALGGTGGSIVARSGLMPA